MAVRVNGTTLVRQEQGKKSSQINDNLPLLDYDNLKTLEDDFNYVRSVLKELKGTANYNTPVTRTLESIASELAAAVFDSVTLTGNSTAETPPLSDASQRIATTEYVTDKISEQLTAANYTHVQGTSSTVWTINHNLNRTPSVTVVDSADQVVIGNVIYVDKNNIEIYFSAEFSGKAYLN